MNDTPSIPRMAVNLARDMGRWAIAGAPVSPQELIKERLDACNICEFFKNERCMKCGCHMKAKASMVTARCPLGKWAK